MARGMLGSRRTGTQRITLANQLPQSCSSDHKGVRVPFTFSVVQ